MFSLIGRQGKLGDLIRLVYNDISMCRLKAMQVALIMVRNVTSRKIETYLPEVNNAKLNSC